MTDNQRLNALLGFMKLPDGSPLVTVNMIDWLTKNSFSVPLPPPSITGIMKVASLTTPSPWQSTWLA